jgi:cellobiose-specific phosphotransferase system component IIA
MGSFNRSFVFTHTREAYDVSAYMVHTEDQGNNSRTFQRLFKDILGFFRDFSTNPIEPVKQMNRK